MDLGAEHLQVLYRSEIRWLSRGKVLTRFYELKAEIAAFLSQTNSPYAELFDSELWLAKVAYLVDVFEHLNTLNLSLQGKGHSKFEQLEKVNAFKRKLALWKIRVTKDRLDMFPNACQEILQLRSATDKSALKSIISAHLNKLQTRFNDYFPESAQSAEEEWVRDPFETDVESAALPSEEENQLIELTCDQSMKTKFSKVSLSQFWCSVTVTSEYSTLARRAIKILLPFSTTYLCESGFSTLVQLKSKQRNRLDTEHDLRIALSTILPDFEALVISKKHPQLSH